MSSRIQLAVRDEQLVTLADVQRREKGLTCYTCGDKLVVKDGRGQRASGIGRRPNPGESTSPIHPIANATAKGQHTFG